jgi:DNA-binding response OmpR family regulator
LPVGTTPPAAVAGTGDGHAGDRFDVVVATGRPDVADPLVAALTRRGLTALWLRDDQPRTALAGPRATAVARVVLLDLELPGLDHEAVLAGLTGGPLVITLSQITDDRRGLDAGAAAHIGVPAPADALVRAVRRALQAGR